MNECKVLTSWRLLDLTSDVNKTIAEGRMPLGGIAIATEVDDRTYYVQAMVK